MFNRIKWGAYAPLILPSCGDMEIMQKLVTLAFPNCKVDLDSNRARNLLQYGVVTLTDGQDEEHYPYWDLIYHRLPYILFSNNLYYVRGFRNQMLQTQAPEKFLATMVERYHTNFKKNKNFHL